MKMWSEEIQHKLDEIVVEKGLPQDSLRLEKNYSKDGKLITSYSICIFEPDYPDGKFTGTRSGNVVNLKEKNNVIEFIVSNSQFEMVDSPVTADIRTLKSDKMNKHILFSLMDKHYIDYISSCVNYALENYNSKNGTFGCCARYKKCSEAGKCLHDNLLYATGCQYRKNLEKGNAYMMNA